MESYCQAHYSLKHRLIAATSRLLDGVTYTQRHGLIRGMRRKGGLGFLPSFFTHGVEDTPETRFLTTLDLANAVVYDIGGFEGVLTLFFSRHARHVVTYEPNPPSFQRLAENLRLNNIRNVELRNAGVGEARQSLTLVCDLLMRGGASVDQAVTTQISGTSNRIYAATIEVVPLDEDIREHGLPPPDFVKIDIEGMELPALRGMQRTLSRYMPSLYLEMHGATIADKEERVTRIVEFLNGLGYHNIRHVESDTPIDIDSATRAREGHIYCVHSGRVRSAKFA
jgi:FkbM family methyltransferase